MDNHETCLQIEQKMIDEMQELRKEITRLKKENDYLRAILPDNTELWEE